MSNKTLVSLLPWEVKQMTAAMEPVESVNEPSPPWCYGCDQEIDPVICHCGDSRAYHDGRDVGHSFVPMGCGCHRYKEPEPKMPPREPTHDWLK